MNGTVQEAQNEEIFGEIVDTGDEGRQVLDVPAPDVYTVGQWVTAAAVIASKLDCPNEVGPGQAGPCEFTIDTVITVCYRLEIAASDLEIRKAVLALKRQGVLEPGSKRGRYVCGAILRYSKEDMVAEAKKALGLSGGKVRRLA